MYYIPVRIASTGSSLDALHAGTIPEINPIVTATADPKTILPKESTNLKSPVIEDAIIDTTQTKNNPIKPPINAKITASNKNWKRINLFLAPNDFEYL